MTTLMKVSFDATSTAPGSGERATNLFRAVLHASVSTGQARGERGRILIWQTKSGAGSFGLDPRKQG
jgi:hypothetical protein